MARKMDKKTVQVLFIHGGMTFRNRKDYLRYLKTRVISLESYKRWSGSYLTKRLGKRFEIIRPDFPLRDNARYEDWKITFERYVKLLEAPYMLIGSSLGGIFLAQYLSEHKLKTKPISVYLVAPPFDDTCIGEDLAGGFKLASDLSLLEKNSKHLHLFFSKDDDCVPIAHADKYAKKLKRAQIKVYKSKGGHFHVSTFPEIVRTILKDADAI